MATALYWERVKQGEDGVETGGEMLDVRCTLCFHRCRIRPGRAGFCGVRVNRGGTLASLVADNAVSLGLDPVEKKPLFHFLPGTRTLSLGTLGCNFACRFCQNSGISRSPSDTGVLRRGTRVNGRGLVRLAKEKDAPSISCTYNEPTIFYELVKDIGLAAQEAGLRVVLVSNGCMAREPLLALKDLVHAVNIDLKAFTSSFYSNICSGSLKQVLENLPIMKRLGWWVEVTTLLIPGLNDSEKEIRDIARFIREDLGRETPWHISAFHPAYQMMDRPRTSPKAIHEACLIGRAEGLHYVYGGNVVNPEDEATCCPECHAVCFGRLGFRVHTRSGGVCPSCGAKLAGVWE